MHKKMAMTGKSPVAKKMKSGGMAKAYMKNKSEQAADKIKQVSQEKLMNIKPKDKVKN